MEQLEIKILLFLFLVLGVCVTKANGTLENDQLLDKKFQERVVFPLSP